MQPIHANASNFEATVLKAEGPVLVDFWAEWCPPCRVLGPMLERAAETFGERVTIVKVDADENAALMQTYAISSIPTLVLFNGGAEIERRFGPEGLKPLSARALSLVA